jgi:hypothetical protein
MNDLENGNLREVVRGMIKYLKISNDIIIEYPCITHIEPKSCESEYIIYNFDITPKEGE